MSSHSVMTWWLKLSGLPLLIAPHYAMEMAAAQRESLWVERLRRSWTYHKVESSVPFCLAPCPSAFCVLFCGPGGFPVTGGEALTWCSIETTFRANAVVHVQLPRCVIHPAHHIQSLRLVLTRTWAPSWTITTSLDGTLGYHGSIIINFSPLDTSGTM